MEAKVLQEIVECLPKTRTLFHYGKDHYAALLLGYEAGYGKKISALKHGRFGQLLQKPSLKAYLGGLGVQQVDKSIFEAFRYTSGEPHVLTLGRWGRDKYWRYGQVSRPGNNIVLQLNFNNKYDQKLRRYLKMENECCHFNYCGHPVSRVKHTLAWARIDLDFDTNEALVEEVQNDWLRGAERFHRYAVNKHKRTNDQRVSWLPWHIEGAHIDDICRYYEQVVVPYKKLWSEAMLAAAIWFIREELGINSVYYHTFDTGYALKTIGGKAPPKSLYTQLPRKFCFEETRETPEFLTQNKRFKRVLKAVDDPKWYRLSL